jgi:hypothetical protein
VDEATGYEWFAEFEIEDEALSQAASDAHVYGGVAPQEVLDASDAVVADQNAIIVAADALE